MTIPFRIFPSSGYKNSQFQAVSSIHNLSIRIEREGKIVAALSSSPDRSATLLKLTEPGTYRASATHNGDLYEQYFQVVDAIRIGSSELKNVFVFDLVPYTFIVMRDRMLIYDEMANVLLEENISPTSIIQLDQRHLLLQTSIGSDPKTKLQITNLGIYALENLSIQAELLDDCSLIWLDIPRKRVWLYHLTQQRIICLSTKGGTDTPWAELLSQPANSNYTLQDGRLRLFSQSDNEICLINTTTLQIVTTAKSPYLALDEAGYCYKLTGRTLFRGNTPGAAPEQLLGNIPEVASLEAKGFYYVGENFKLAHGTSRFDQRVSAIRDAYPPEADKKVSRVILPTPETVDWEPFSCTLYPAVDGAYILETNRQQTISGLYYQFSPTDELRTNPIHTTHWSYELLHYGKGKQNSLIAGVSPISITHARHGLLIAHYKSELIAYSQLIQGATFTALDSQASEYRFISTDTNQHYITAASNSKIDLFRLGSPITQVLSKAQIIDKNKLAVDDILWFLSESDEPAGYNLKTAIATPFALQGGHQSLLAKAQIFKFNNGYVLANNQALVTAQGRVRATVPGIIVAVSSALNKVICRRDEELYVLTYQNTGMNYTSCTVPFSLLNYQESYLSPDGKFLMLRDATQKYLLYNIVTGETSTYFSGKFLAFDKSGSLIFEGNKNRFARLIDPVTFEDVTPLSYHHYRFQSPDGKLFAQTIAKKRYYGHLVSRYLTESEVLWYRTELDYVNGALPKDEVDIEKVNAKRQAFYNANAEYYTKLGVKYLNQVTSSSVIATHQKLEIGVVGTSNLAEVALPSGMSWFNYAAFSFDSKWIAAVGKYPGCGFITIAKVNFDSTTSSISVEECFESNYPNKAVWVCGISKTGYFASYDSDGDTYILNTMDLDSAGERTRTQIKDGFITIDNSIYSQSENWRVVEGMNFLCFSPSGRFMALSENWYHPLSKGGSGHQESNAVHIAMAKDGFVIDSFRGHGGPIKDNVANKLIFAAFSEDEQSLMTMSNDGVVIVRHIADKLLPHSRQ